MNNKINKQNLWRYGKKLEQRDGGEMRLGDGAARGGSLLGCVAWSVWLIDTKSQTKGRREENAQSRLTSKGEVRKKAVRDTETRHGEVDQHTHLCLLHHVHAAPPGNAAPLGTLIRPKFSSKSRMSFSAFRDRIYGRGPVAR